MDPANSKHDQAADPDNDPTTGGGDPPRALAGRQDASNSRSEEPPAAAPRAAPTPPTDESPTKGGSSTEPPREHDILLGRGRPYQTHGGNLRMLKIVAEHKPLYQAKPRDEKRSYVDTVLKVLSSGGARFLKQVDATGTDQKQPRWEEVAPEVAANKVWHALRCKGKKKPRNDDGDDDNAAEEAPKPKKQKKQNDKDPDEVSPEKSHRAEDPNLPQQSQHHHIPRLAPAPRAPMALPATRIPLAPAPPIPVAAPFSRLAVDASGLLFGGMNPYGSQHTQEVLARLGITHFGGRREYRHWTAPDHLCFPPYGQSGRRLRMILDELNLKNTPAAASPAEDLLGREC